GMAGMPLVRPAWLLLAVPPLLADILSSHYGQADLKLHYGLLLVVPVFVAGLMGARALAGGLRNADMVVLIPALVVAWVTSPLVLPAELPALDRLRACTHALPAAAPVAADDAVAAPLAARPLIVPTALAAGSMYIVVDRTGREPAYVDRAGRMAVINSLGGDGRKMLCDDGRFQLWSPATS
ncbi:MAG: hypothetical protein M3Z13_00965, partial [Candidatus Dormibacteraeota bacterium]|nr:hypothetical protein [Candidatus Dormibacteraeota bacterium]